MTLFERVNLQLLRHGSFHSATSSSSSLSFVPSAAAAAAAVE